MPPRRRIPRWAVPALVVAVLAAPSAAAGAPRPLRTPAPVISVVPSRNLHNRQIVRVWGRHFPRRALLVMVECNPRVGKSGAAACNTATATFVTASATGAFSGKPFRVVTGKVGNGTCGRRTSLTCYLEVSLPTPKSKAHAVAALHFAAP